MCTIIHKPSRAEMWTPFLDGLDQNSLKWKLCHLPTILPVLNQLLNKSSEVKEMHILLSDLLRLNASHHGQVQETAVYEGWMISHT